MRRVAATDWFRIAGRGIVVAVDVPATDGIRQGEHVQFDLSPSSPGTPGLIGADATYRVTGVEESRCLVHHGNGRQCVMGRGLAVTLVPKVTITTDASKVKPRHYTDEDHEVWVDP